MSYILQDKAVTVNWNHCQYHLYDNYH